MKYRRSVTAGLAWSRYKSPVCHLGSTDEIQIVTGCQLQLESVIRQTDPTLFVWLSLASDSTFSRSGPGSGSGITVHSSSLHESNLASQWLPMQCDEWGLTRSEHQENVRRVEYIQLVTRNCGLFVAVCRPCIHALYLYSQFNGPTRCYS